MGSDFYARRSGEGPVRTRMQASTTASVTGLVCQSNLDTSVDAGFTLPRHRFSAC